MEPKRRRKNDTEPELSAKDYSDAIPIPVPGCSSSSRNKKTSEIDSDTVIVKHGEHHVQHELCYTRAKYRQGKEYKAVKVYTINDESKHLIIQDVPDIGLKDELEKLCRRFGAFEEFRLVNKEEYPPCNPFTAVYYAKYASLHLARYAKSKLDDRAFYGGLLHICYAPEMETVDETRAKLQGRIRYVQTYPTKQAKHKK